MADLERLLGVQGLDTRLDQLRHRLATHPARAAIAGVEAERGAAAAELAAATAEQDDLLRQQRRWDDEVAKVAARRTEIDGSLYGGSVTSPKELLALQADAESLRRRQVDLEDHELEVMEQVEAVAARMAATQATIVGLDQRLEELRQELTAATAELEVELERVASERAEAAAPLPSEVLATYEDLRRELGGVAVARLNGSTCEGCHLSLSAMTVDQIKKLPPDQVARCEECGRILVR